MPETLITPDNAIHAPCTDLGNAERFVAKWLHTIHYCYERRKWVAWNGEHWVWDDGAFAGFLASLTVREIYREAADEPDRKIRDELSDHAKKSESDARINSMLELAKSQPGIPINHDAFDSDLYLFNVNNGTLDLKTGEFRKHDRKDYLTFMVDIDYDPLAQCPIWETFIDQITDGKIEKQKYIQRAIGYSLTGDCSEQVLFFLYGLIGANGKSTLVSAIRKLAGPYGAKVSTDLFMMKDRNSGGPKEGLANLQGKRFVVASEIEDGRNFAVSLIKDMTGGETIKADRKYEHEIEFQPTHKIWFTANNKPGIKESNRAIWRRVKLITFDISFEDKKDVKLPQKLEAELPGILNWALYGCLEWQRIGLSEPDVITNATEEYRNEQDILKPFIEDIPCIVKPEAIVSKAELKTVYLKYCQDNGLIPLSQNTFKKRLLERGITEKKSGSTRYWQGIGLQDVPSQAQWDKTGHDFPENIVTHTRIENLPENSLNKSPSGTNLGQNVPTEQKDVPAELDLEM